MCAGLSGRSTRCDGAARRDGRLILPAEGVVRHAAVFGEPLETVRGIEHVGDEIRLTDWAISSGFARSPRMPCCHVDVGHPVMAKGARYPDPIEDVIWAAHADTWRDQGVGQRTMFARQAQFCEQALRHEMAWDAAGEMSVARVGDALALGFEVVTCKTQFLACTSGSICGPAG